MPPTLSNAASHSRTTSLDDPSTAIGRMRASEARSSRFSLKAMRLAALHRDGQVPREDALADVREAVHQHALALSNEAVDDRGGGSVVESASSCRQVSVASVLPFGAPVLSLAAWSASSVTGIHVGAASAIAARSAFVHVMDWTCPLAPGCDEAARFGRPLRAPRAPASARPDARDTGALQ